MKQRILTFSITALPKLIQLGGLSISDVKCQADEYHGARKSEIMYPIDFLERTFSIHNYNYGCSIVAAWRGSGIYLCHEEPEVITIDSRELGRLAHEGSRACWTRSFIAEVRTAENITVRLERPMGI
ncbi:hypothetical protein FE257_006975 [Aspergillus nanangensis]|uniref:Uncharacterized protein n=1 Tax=Aspergillus nanangensis TaxID=2582783 RepID=A0AAD4GMQ8_ASPNN|nr:hypothetical protein FE257_006975 [Aspergillus nanangensis]